MAGANKVKKTEVDGLIYTIIGSLYTFYPSYQQMDKPDWVEWLVKLILKTNCHKVAGAVLIRPNQTWLAEHPTLFPSPTNQVKAPDLQLAKSVSLKKNGKAVQLKTANNQFMSVSGTAVAAMLTNRTKVQHGASSSIIHMRNDALLAHRTTPK